MPYGLGDPCFSPTAFLFLCIIVGGSICNLREHNTWTIYRLANHMAFITVFLVAVDRDASLFKHLERREDNMDIRKENNDENFGVGLPYVGTSRGRLC